MRIRCSLLALLALAAGTVQAAVTVESTNPDKFADAGDRSNDPVKVMKALAEHLKGLGAKYLPPGTDVKIEVLDLDRAGRTRMNLPTEIRVMSGKADPPCIDLRYTVKRGGTSEPPHKEHLCDTDYLRPLGVGYRENDPLVYEKRMLTEWFQQRFAPKGARAR
jgi:hypothetical protein